MKENIIPEGLGKMILDKLNDLQVASKKFFNKEEAAKYLGVSEDSIGNYIKAGEIAFSRPGGRRILISRDDLDAFIGRSRKPSKAEIEEMAATHVVMGAR